MNGSPVSTEKPTKSRRGAGIPLARHLAAAWVVSCLALGCGPSDPASSKPAAARPAPDQPAASVQAGGPVEGSEPAAPRGFVVWESNRSGAWRLWTSDLDGAGARQLTPDETRRQHCCAHIAPGGSRIAYLSLPSGRARYLDESAVGELRMIDPRGASSRVLAPRARTYFEHRAAVWIDDSSLHYIGDDGSVARLDVETGASTTVLESTGDLSRRWLIDAAGRWAATGRGALAPLRGGRLGAETPLPGCQPYFSRDGRWGFWTAGAGGPIDRFDLASGETATILRKSDSRLPADRGYLYFPMLSSDGTLLAFAASDGEHDHHRADYDIFVTEVDPATLEPLGSPWPVASDPAVDRFPDLWRPAGLQNPDLDTGLSPEPALRSLWPARTDGLLWSWSAAGVGPTTELRRDGQPVAGSGRLLDLALGPIVATDTAALLYDGLKRTNQLSLELVLNPAALAKDQLGAIVGIGREASRENLLLAQRGDRLVLRLRVGPKGRDAYAQADLGPLPAESRVHLAITYSPGRTAVYLDGREVLRSAELRGHFYQWRPYSLTLGDRGRGGAAWPGGLEVVAIYDRPLSPSEIGANAELTGRVQG